MFIFPMLLHKLDEPYNADDYISELKLDGIRLLLCKMEGQVTLYTRHKTIITKQFPELLNVDIQDGTILDGELI